MSKTRIAIIVAIWIAFGTGLPMKRLRPGKPEIAKIQIAQLEGALGLFRFDVGRYKCRGTSVRVTEFPLCQ